MRKHERDILLMCDVAHKVMRNDTVYDLMDEILKADRANFQNNLKQKALGLTVLTAYNNKTYRIDDIDFEKSPLTTFDQRGTAVSLKDYYRTVSFPYFFSAYTNGIVNAVQANSVAFFIAIIIIHFRNTISTSEMKSSHCLSPNQKKRDSVAVTINPCGWFPSYAASLAWLNANVAILGKFANSNLYIDTFYCQIFKYSYVFVI